MAAAALIVGAIAPAAFAATGTVSYTDINGNFAEQDIISLSQQGYIHGYSDGQYRPNELVTRGQFLAYFMNVVKSATAVSPGAHKQYFADIPPRNWDYNYVGAAEAAGWLVPSWINVKLGGRFNENYQASWGDAASFFVAAMERAGKLTSTGGMAPLAYAKSIGLFQGIPSSQNQIYLNRASAAVVLYNILSYVKNGGSATQTPTVSSVTLSGGASLSSNTSEPLTVTAKDSSGNVMNVSSSQISYQVTGSGSTNTAGAFVSASGVLVVTAPGTYNITATVGGVTSAPLVVTVPGAASALKLSAASPSLVADASSTDTLTATVVDANGNPVTSFNGTVSFSDTNGQLVGANGALSNAVSGVSVTNGVATIKVQATATPGTTDTITANNLVQSGSSTPVAYNGGALSGNLAISQTQQVATSLSVTPSSPTVENNAPSTDAFTVQVLDQAGVPMLSGVNTINLSVSGAGQLSPTSQATTAYVGNGTTTAGASGSVTSEQGVTGSIVVTATSPGLTSGSATIQSLVVGSPAAIKVAADKNSSSTFAAGSSGGVFDVSTVDANGNTVNDTSNPTYTATVWQGSTQITSGVTATVAGNQVDVTGTAAGSYTLKVESSDNLTAGTVNFQVTAGPAAKVVFLSPSAAVDLPIQNDSMTIQAELQDSYGNAVTTAGVPVTFSVAERSGQDAATLGGSASGQYTATTGANGVVSVPFVGSHLVGDAWTISATQVNGVSITTAPVYVKMVAAVPTQVNVGMQDTASLPNNNPNYLHSTGYAQAGDTVTVTLSATDAFGNASPNGDVMQVTLPAGLNNPAGLTATSTPGVYTVTLPASGQTTFTATAATEGAATVKVTDLSVGSTTLTGSGTIDIVPGPAVGAALFSNATIVNAANPLAVQANTPIQLWVKPVDIEGNAVVQGQQPLTLNLSDGGKGGSFRLTPQGGNISSIQIPAGSSEVMLYYVNATAGIYVLSAQAAASSTTS